jgi:quinol monooxygenase YgiN
MEYPAEATFFTRLSLMDPRPGMRDRVIEMHAQLLDWLPSQPGYVRGYLVIGGDPQGRVGHIDVWRSEQEADQAAQSAHVLALRAELLLLIDEDSHAEHKYTTIDPKLAKASS